MPTVAQKIQWLVEDLRAYQPERVILFGSAARGDADADSDLDVVIIKRTIASFVQRGVDAVRHVRPALAPVDLLVYTPEEFQRMIEDENPFIERVLAEGRVLYETAA
ncbi:MAG: nucleotidyltransferase domain-containing protein [Candidatus Omnitrophica bacterium]|nr:nucleotidyltransferase domain-containing protein [Candidatus Omnitrophota bacterium]